MADPAPTIPASTRRAGPSAFGALLRQWRDCRRLSQLDLALESEVSPKHVSFLETGRSSPSREMVLRLAEVLDIPLRQRNTLLQSAGFASHYRERQLDDPAFASVRRSIEFLLDRHDPYPALLCDRAFEVEHMNAAASRLFSSLLPMSPNAAPNLVRALFEPGMLREHIVNWHEVGAAMIQRLHHEVAAHGPGSSLTPLLDEVLALPGIPREWRRADLDADLRVVLPVHVRTRGFELKLFSALTTLGTALDVTLQELVIETFLPADDASDRLLRQLAEAS